MDSCCLVCQGITGLSKETLLVDIENGYKHHKWAGMVESMAKGCIVCKTVVERFNPRYTVAVNNTQGQSDIAADTQVFVQAIWNTAEDQVEPEGVITPFGKRQLQKLEFHVKKDEVSLHPKGMGIELTPVFDDPAARYVARKTEFKKFDDDASLALRKSVIDCLTDHSIDDCPGKRTGQLPRRILDVGAVRTDETVDEDGPVKLKESQKGEIAIYTTLSYCWGDAQHQLTTTKATLQSRLQGLPLGEIPKTIADAIRVTRHLGIQYLWVDSLCIIQDDEVDKLEQIDAMSEIFRESTVTIAASSAANVSEGFLTSAKPLKAIARLPLVLSENEQIVELGKIYLRGDWVRVSVNDEPLYSRAWTFQETMLSPRVLDFNTYNSMHMCSDSDYPPLFSGYKITDHEWPGSEIFRNLHRLEASKMFQALYFMHPRYFFRLGEFDRDTFGMWREVIYQYTGRRLTLPTDRLPALSGIAKRLSPYGGNYVAGLWKESLVHHLGWEHNIMYTWPQGRTEGDSIPANIQNEVVDYTQPRPSPTWSWVSVPYGACIAPLSKADTTLLDCQVTPVSEINPHGQVKQGTLTLKARVLQYHDLPLEPSVLHDGALDSFDKEQVFIRLDHREPVPNGEERSSLNFLYLGERSHYDEENNRSLKETADARTFLVIHKCSNCLNFRRIGILHIPETHQVVQSGQLGMILDSAELQTVSLE